MRFWRALREHPHELADAVALTPYGRAEWEHCKAEPDHADDVEAARRFLVHIDQSFSREGTGWSPPSIRVDRRGRWQAGVWQNMPPKLLAAAHRLAGVAHECADASSSQIRPARRRHLLRPAIRPKLAARARQGLPARRRRQILETLVEVLRGVRNASVLLSGYPCAEAESLGWRAVPLRHQRTVQARAGSKLTAAPEVLWLSPHVPTLAHPHTGKDRSSYN